MYLSMYVYVCVCMCVCQNDGSFCMGSCYGPICVSASPLPVLVFKQLLGAGNGWALVATGTVSSVDPDRIMLKKASSPIESSTSLAAS